MYQMRIRTIKPEFWKSEEISTLSNEAKLLAIGILNYADDEGYFNANYALIKAELFPLNEVKNIEKLLSELIKINYIEIRQHENTKSYGRVVKFNEHQRVNRPYASKIKDLFEFTEHSLNAHGIITEHSLQERKGKERKGITLESLNLEDLLNWIKENNLDEKKVQDELMVFKDKCIAKGYKYSDYAKAFQLWIRNEKYGNGINKFKKSTKEVL
jgi:hypothetical protein